MSGGLMAPADDLSEEELKVDMKECIDNFYLNNNHQSLIDIISCALQLSKKYGVLVK